MAGNASRWRWPLGIAIVLLIISVPVVAMFPVLALHAYVFWMSGGFSERETEVFRYRLTLNVSYNGKQYSGSSVIEGHRVRRLGTNSAGSTGMRTFCSARGTAPLVKLGDDGGWVFASVGGGSGIQWLPWKAHQGRTNATNDDGSLKRLPKDPPRIEIPFSDPRAKYLYELYYVPPGPEGPKQALRLLADGGAGRRTGLEHTPRDPSMIFPNQLAEKTGRDIKLVSFALEKTDAPVVERIEGGPGWLSDLRSTNHPARMPSVDYKFSRMSVETAR